MLEYERIARIMRGDTERIQRLEQDRDVEGSVNQVRFVEETPRESIDEASVTDRADGFTYGNQDWGFAAYDRS